MTALRKSALRTYEPVCGLCSTVVWDILRRTVYYNIQLNAIIMQSKFVKHVIKEIGKSASGKALIRTDDPQLQKFCENSAQLLDKALKTDAKKLWQHIFKVFESDPIATFINNSLEIKNKTQTFLQLKLSAKQLVKTFDTIDERLGTGLVSSKAVDIEALRQLQGLNYEISGFVITKFNGFKSNWQKNLKEQRRKEERLKQQQEEERKRKEEEEARIRREEEQRKRREEEEAAKAVNQQQKESAPLSSAIDQYLALLKFSKVKQAQPVKEQKAESSTRPSDQILQGLLTSEKYFQYPVIEDPKTLADQDYKCKGCGGGLSNGLYLVCSNANFCNYDNSYYCNECFSFERVPIWYKAIEDFDLKGYAVATCNKKNADMLRNRPNIQLENNHRIVTQNERVFRFLVLKRELHLMYDMICDPKLILNILDNERMHYVVKPNLLSLKNLVDISNGSEEKRMAHFTDILSRHFYKCKDCLQKGVTCKICKTEIKIFPFDIRETVGCKGCSRLYHRHCLLVENCPVCTH